MIDIKAFPLDDTDYLAEDLRKWFFTRTSGVFSADDNLMVSANSDMSVTVSPGIAFLNDGQGGLNAWNPYSAILKVPIADNMLDRIDNVVFRWDKKSNKVGVDLVRGDLAESPIPKPPVRDANTYEIVLAQIAVTAGSGAITAGMITDTRLNESVCGVMRDGVTGIPTQALYDQFVAWVDSLKDIIDENTAAHLLNLIQTHTHAFSDITGKPSVYPPAQHSHAEYKIKGDFAVVTGTITTPASGETSLTGEVIVSYPSGFNKDTSVIVSLMAMRTSNVDRLQWSTTTKSGGIGHILGSCDLTATMKDDGIRVFVNKADESAPSTVISIKLTLMKV